MINKYSSLLSRISCYLLLDNEYEILKARDMNVFDVISQAVHF